MYSALCKRPWHARRVLRDSGGNFIAATCHTNLTTGELSVPDEKLPSRIPKQFRDQVYLGFSQPSEFCAGSIEASIARRHRWKILGALLVS